MRTFGVISVVLCLMSMKGPAGERLFDKLNRKYNQDPAKCLEYATKLKKKKSQEPEVYYFLARMNYERFDTMPLLRKRYSALNKASSEAYRMNKYLNKSAYLISIAKPLRDTLAVQVKQYRDTFLRLEDYDKAERLAFHYKRLTGFQLPTLKEIEQEEKEKMLLPRLVDGKYYGLPSGDERLPSSNYEMEKRVVAILNKARVEKGMEPLKWDETLAQAARYHANDMATQRYFSHTTCDRIDGEVEEIGNAFRRIRKFYHGPGFANSENIAAGGNTAEFTYHQWYTSKGHHDNMFNKYSKWVGVGYVYNPDSPYKYYWVFCTAR